MNAEVAGMLQVAIGGILMSAGAAKIGYRASLAPFLVAAGFSARRAVLISRATPAVECVLGMVLLADVIALPVAAAAILLSGAFSVVLIHAYRSGVHEPCHCFGMLDTDRLSIVPVARAVLLTGAAIGLTTISVGIGVVAPNPIWRSAPLSGVVGLVLGAAFVAAFALVEQMSSFERGRQRFFA